MKSCVSTVSQSGSFERKPSRTGSLTCCIITLALTIQPLVPTPPHPLSMQVLCAHPAVAEEGQGRAWDPGANVAGGPRLRSSPSLDLLFILPREVKTNHAHTTPAGSKHDRTTARDRRSAGRIGPDHRGTYVGWWLDKGERVGTEKGLRLREARTTGSWPPYSSSALITQSFSFYAPLFCNATST